MEFDVIHYESAVSAEASTSQAIGGTSSKARLMRRATTIGIAAPGGFSP